MQYYRPGKAKLQSQTRKTPEQISEKRNMVVNRRARYCYAGNGTRGKRKKQISDAEL